MSSVSFVIPVFNKSLYLDSVINSVKNQKGNFKKEYIFINDGSTDNSLNILKDKTKNLRNCKILTQKNMGSAGATNAGIKLARMKYIKFLDADDIIIQDATISLMKILESNPNAVLAYGLQRKVTNIKLVKLKENFDHKNYEIVKNHLKKAMRNSMFNPTQFLARSKECKIVNGCDERIVHSQEYSLTLRLARLGSFFKLNYPIAVLPFEAPGQISEKKNNQIFRVSKALEFFLKENKDLSIFYKLYGQRRLTARSWRFARRFKKKYFFSKYFFLYLAGLVRLPFFHERICNIANEVYEDFLD
jgi:glycosyltransferase involved in cell wall biosynthesis